MRIRRYLLLLGILWLMALRSGLAAPVAKPELVVQNGHVFEVTAIAFAANDRLIATGSQDGAVKLWDIDSGRLLWTLAPKISPDTGSTEVVDLAFSPDRKVLFTSTHGGNIQRWDTATGKLLGDCPVASPKYRVPIAVSRDNKFLYVGGDGVEIYDLASRKKVDTLPDSRMSVVSLVLSLDGRTLVAGGTSGDVRAWDTATRKLVGKVVAAYHNNAQVAVSGDGRMVAIGCGKAEVWKVGSATTTHIDLAEPTTYVRVGMSPDGRRVAVGGDKNGLYDAVTGKFIAAIHADYPISVMAFGPDGKALAVGDPLGRVQFYSVDPVRATISLQGHAQARGGVAFTQRGLRMVTTGLDRTVKVWDCVAGRPSTVIQLPWDGVLNHRRTAMAATADGRQIATGSWDGSIEVWDAETGKKLWTSMIGGPRFRQEVTGLAFSRDGRLLAVGSTAGILGIWEATTGKFKFANENGPDTAILSLAFSPDGRTVAAGRADGILDQWDVSHFKLAHVTERSVYAASPRFKAIWAVAFSPDGRRLAAATAWGNAYIWETESDKEPEILGAQAEARGTYEQKGNKIEVNYQTKALRASLVCAAFSPDASTLATGAVDGTLTVFDLRTKKIRAEGREGNLGLNDLAFTPNGRVIATAGADGTIGLWDATTAGRVATAVELDRGRDWVVTTPDGLFDGSPGGQRLMEWRIGDKFFSLDQFFNEFYTPGLLGRVLDVRKTEGAPHVQALLPQRSLTTFLAPPRVEILSPASGATVSGDTVTVQVRNNEQGGGLSSPRLYLNGHRLPDAKMQVGSGGTCTWAVKLTSGTNRIRATAFNKEGTVESRGDEIRLTCDATASTHPTLHVISVGIDKYQAGLNLAFARADAQAISSFFKPGLFGQVQVHLLTDDKASKQAILDTLREVGKQSAPQDAVLLYLAGHGTLVGDVFYYLPYDARVSSEDDIRRTGLSSVEIGEALTNIAATKQLLVLDACHSGASATPMGKMLANRDSIAEIRAVQRLSRSSGSFLIAASKAEQYAKEIPELGHGVLTYAILTALGEKSKPAATPNGDGQVTVNGLLRYLDDEVPKLTEKYQRGDRQEIVQASTGQDFPLVIVITR